MSGDEKSFGERFVESEDYKRLREVLQKHWVEADWMPVTKKELTNADLLARWTERFGEGK